MPEYSSLFVCLMGMGTVFFGLICLIVLTMIMGKIVGGRPAPAVTLVIFSAAPEASGPRRLRPRPGRVGPRRRPGGQPPGDCRRRLRRHRGGAGDQHHGHPHRIHEKTVRNEKERAS